MQEAELWVFKAYNVHVEDIYNIRYMLLQGYNYTAQKPTPEPKPHFSTTSVVWIGTD